jgi:hypothetical protein
LARESLLFWGIDLLGLSSLDLAADDIGGLFSVTSNWSVFERSGRRFASRDPDEAK